MKKYALIIAACMSVLSINASAQTIKGSKNFITKDVNLESFGKIKATSNVDVTFVQQEGPAKATILTADNVMEYVTATVADGVLTVGIKEGTNVSAKKLEVTVYAPNLQEVEGYGSGDVKCSSVKTDNFTVVLSGKGDVDVKTVECTGVCTIKVNGNGSGDMDLGNIQCGELIGTLLGNGDVRVGKVNGEKVVCTVSGTGSIELSGKVKFVDFNVTDAGSINAGMLQAENGQARNTGSGSVNTHVYGHLDSRNMGGGINNSK